MTVVTNEKNEVVHGVGDAEENESTTEASSGGPTVTTSSESVRGSSSAAEPSTPSSETFNKQTIVPPTSQDTAQQASTEANTSSTDSPKQGPTATATPTSKPSNSGTSTAPPSGSSTPVPPTSASSSSSNGLMGRLKHSVKKLTRTPSAEQKFENGRSSGSRKISISTGGSAPVSKAPSSPSIPEGSSTTASTSLPVSTGTGTSTSTASSSPRTTMVIPESQGSGATKADDDQSTSDTTSSHSVESALGPATQLPSSAISVRPPHPPFTPPGNLECPAIAIPPHIPVIISELSREASSSVDLYRGTVGTLEQDYVPLVQVIPTWLLELLLKGTIPIKESAKVSFVLRPYHSQESTLETPGSGPRRLGELPGGNPRLTAPRMLRIRKVIAHVVEKLALSPPKRTTAPIPGSTPSIAPGQNDSQPDSSNASLQSNLAKGEPHDNGNPSQSGMPHESASTEGPVALAKTKEQEEEEEEEEYMRQQALRPENWLEILCNDQLLSPTMTLATIRAHYWKSGSDVVLTYRYKPTSTVPGGANASAGASTSTLAATTGSLHSNPI